MEYSIHIKWICAFVNLRVSGLGFIHFSFIVKRIINMSYAKSEGPDQTPRFAASDLDLHCLPMSYL